MKYSRARAWAQSEGSEWRIVGRVKLITDAIFAIAMRLLVLKLKYP